MQRRVWFAGLVCVLAVLALGYTGWKSFAHADVDQCYACKRPIHAHSKTVAFIGGGFRVFLWSAVGPLQNGGIHRRAIEILLLSRVRPFPTPADGQACQYYSTDGVSNGESPFAR